MTVTLDDIRAARQKLGSRVITTPLLPSRIASEASGCQVHCKAENLQEIGAFKIRGALNRVSLMSQEEKQRGVVAYSSGNHAQGVALAARLEGMHATIVMPADTPEVKVEGTRRLGAEIIFYNRATESRESIARELAEATGATIVPPFDDPDVIAGQGTCGLELMEQYQEFGQAPDILLCPVGGGGLIAGVSTAIKALNADVQIFGVEPVRHDDHYQSWLSGTRVTVNPEESSFCDALLASAPGEITWEITRQNVEGFLTVTDEEVSRAVSFAFRYLKLVVEPGGAVGLAALLAGKLEVQDKRVCLLLSGGNIDKDVFIQCLQQFPDPLQA